MVLSKRSVHGSSEASALPTCSHGAVPPRPLRQLSEDGTAYHHMPVENHRNMSVSTSAPSVYENYVVSHTRDSIASRWMSSEPRRQSYHFGSSVDPLKGELLGFEGERYKKKRFNVVPNVVMYAAIFMFVLPWIGHRATLRRNAKIVEAMIALKAEHQGILESIEKKTRRVRALEESVRLLEGDNHRMLADLHATGEVFLPDDSSYKKMAETEDALITRLDTLRTRVQKDSKMSVKEHFGPGPHRVEVVLRDSSKEEVSSSLSDSNKFVIEMAPLDLMPHAVNQFLQMVSLGLWDGLSFVHRDLHSHVLQATPLDVKNAKRVDERFHDANLSKLAFSEYSPDYPHKAYTVGFAGRPGGPDFYVNTIDNTEAHGPLDNSHETDEGESCFGTVISGRDVLDNLLLGEGDSAKIKLVEIDSIRLLQ